MTEKKKAAKPAAKKDLSKYSINELRSALMSKVESEIEKLEESDNTKAVLKSYLARISKF